MTRRASSEIHTSWINDKSSGQSDPIYLSFFIGHLSFRVRGGPGAPRSEREVVQDTFAATLSLQYPLPFAPRPLCWFTLIWFSRPFDLRRIFRHPRYSHPCERFAQPFLQRSEIIAQFAAGSFRITGPTLTHHAHRCGCHLRLAAEAPGQRKFQSCQNRRHGDWKFQPRRPLTHKPCQRCKKTPKGHVVAPQHEFAAGFKFPKR